MDDLEDMLTSLLGSVPGATMAALLGMDGVGVEVILRQDWRDMELAVLEVELAALSEAVQKAAARMGASASPDFFLGTAQANFLGQIVDPAYFLVLGLEPTSDLALARTALGQASAALAE
jgi:predicted regulator of Ras-like GTPase activity (Roadblock/LC7/MglB family)